MAQFDVYRTPRGELVIDCQADLLAGLNSRVVVPLVSDSGGAPPVSARLNPTFVVDGEKVVMKTHFLAALPVRDIGKRVTTLAHERYVIQAALDMLLTGV